MSTAGSVPDGDGTSTPDWETVLGALELEARSVERGLAEDRFDAASWGRRIDDWIPPSGLGPLPEDLRERAAAVLQHQLAVAEDLVERIIQSRRQRDLAARMSYAPSRPVASFVDRAL